MEEVDILECENLAVCDAYDGEINILGQQVSKVLQRHNLSKVHL